MCGGGGEGAAIGCELAAFLWADQLAKLIRGDIHGMCSLT